MRRVEAVMAAGFLGMCLAGCPPQGGGHAAAARPTTEEATPPGEPAPAPVGAAPAAAGARGPSPAVLERVLVPGDAIASVVRAEDGSGPTTVFMPGICSNANAYLQTFPEAARRQGGVVALEGDQPCGAEGFHSFSWDAGRQHARVEAALAAAGLHDIPAAGLTLVGYSQGAALAEQMVQRWPRRYARVVLIGAPSDPAPRSFARARGLVTMSCDRDVPARMRQAATATTRAGVPALYIEMRGCSHGQVTEGERVFDSAFDWLRTNERPADPAATSVRIIGDAAS